MKTNLYLNILSQSYKNQFFIRAFENQRLFFLRCNNTLYSIKESSVKSVVITEYLTVLSHCRINI